jgi:hypothetical protein
MAQPSNGVPNEKAGCTKSNADKNSSCGVGEPHLPKQFKGHIEVGQLFGKAFITALNQANI